jgi:hypothetical protein
MGTSCSIAAFSLIRKTSGKEASTPGRLNAASAPDTPHPVGIILIVVVLVAIGEVLVPRVVSIVLRRRPVVGVTLAISWSGKAIFAFRAFTLRHK